MATSKIDDLLKFSGIMSDLKWAKATREAARREVHRLREELGLVPLPAYNGG